MLTLQAQKRTILGKKTLRLRRQGIVPGILYGGGEDPLPLSVLYADFKKAFREAGESSLVDLEVDGRHYSVLIKDVAHDPVSDRFISIDFFRVPLDKEIEIDVPFQFVGESKAVKELGGILVKVIHEITVSATAQKLPHEIVVDLSLLQAFGDKVFVRDLVIPEGVRVLRSPDEVIVLVDEPREEAEEETKPVDMESIEVVGKGKKEVEEKAEEEKEAAKAPVNS